eukprot:974564-Pyramimonas_sp.AAC.1
MDLSSERRSLAWYLGVDVEGAGRLGSLIINLAMHGAGWIEACVIVEMLGDEGCDRVWARFVRALAQLPPDAA